MGRHKKEPEDIPVNAACFTCPLVDCLYDLTSRCPYCSNRKKSVDEIYNRRFGTTDTVKIKNILDSQLEKNKPISSRIFKKNGELRQYLYNNNILLGDLAKKIGISKTTMSNVFRHDLTPRYKDAIIKGINSIFEERGSKKRLKF